MFFLSHSVSALVIASAILVSVLFAGLLEVALVVGAHGAILLAFLDWVIPYYNLGSDCVTELCM